MEPGNDKPSPLGAMLVAGTGVGGIGCAIPILVIAAIFAGRKLDAWLGTSPWILVTLLFVAIAAGVGFMLSSAYSAARSAQRQYDAQRRRSAYGAEEPHDAYGEETR